jgi:DNA-binding PadR family transcriptional regulator
MTRPTLAQLRHWVLFELDNEWRSPTEIQRSLGLGGHEFYRVALVLERLAADGWAERKTPGTKVRKFRKRAA